MADVAFNDQDGLYYVVDVETHRLGKKSNLPNLTSVERGSVLRRRFRLLRRVADFVQRRWIRRSDRRSHLRPN